MESGQRRCSVRLLSLEYSDIVLTISFVCRQAVAESINPSHPSQNGGLDTLIASRFAPAWQFAFTSSSTPKPAKSSTLAKAENMPSQSPSTPASGISLFLPMGQLLQSWIIMAIFSCGHSVRIRRSANSTKRLVSRRN